MLNSTTIFDCSQPQIVKTSYADGRKQVGTATTADQQAAAAAAPLKCPRCDSTNTKFCYYNNYSLSQPRHFCKACKRYWTRGGTLRNVPVGGGCRKIKPRVRQSSAKFPSASYKNSYSIDTALDERGGSQGQMEEANLGLSGFLYRKNNSNMEMFNGFGASRVTDLDPASMGKSFSAYSQSNSLGLGISPMEYMTIRNNETVDSSHLSSYSNLFGLNFSSLPVYSPLMQSVLGPYYEYKKPMNESSPLEKGHMGNFMSVLPLGDMHIDGNGGGLRAGIKDEELGQMKLNQMESLFSPNTNPTFYNWNNGASNMNNSWSDVPDIGSSSVMSLL